MSGMQLLHTVIEQNVILAWFLLICSFIVLSKCADIFVDSSVLLAHRFRIPKLIIGIVLVSLATTMPELSVSLMSAIKNEPQMALGNAIGSVICDDGLALALCGILSVTAIPIVPHILKTSGVFLLFIELLCFFFIYPDRTLERWEGGVLVAFFAGYIWFLFHQHRKGIYREEPELAGLLQVEKNASLWRLILMFLIAFGGILLASEFIISSATTIARSLGIPNAVIALTLVALGTSIPEVATCISAARKGEGAIAVGNIIGADIMNICWVAGASAIVNDLTISRKEMLFMFPSMIVIVAVMLILLRAGYSLTRRKGWVLLACYAAYLACFFVIF